MKAQSAAVLAGIDSIEHGSFLQDDTLQLMKTKGTYYVPTADGGARAVRADREGRWRSPPIR